MKALLIDLQGELGRIIDLTAAIRRSGVNGEAAEMTRAIETSAKELLKQVQLKLLDYAR